MWSHSELRGKFFQPPQAQNVGHTRIPRWTESTDNLMIALSRVVYGGHRGRAAKMEAVGFTTYVVVVAHPILTALVREACSFRFPLSPFIMYVSSQTLVVESTEKFTPTTHHTNCTTKRETHRYTFILAIEFWRF